MKIPEVVRRQRLPLAVLALAVGTTVTAFVMGGSDAADQPPQAAGAPVVGHYDYLISCPDASDPALVAGSEKFVKGGLFTIAVTCENQYDGGTQAPDLNKVPHNEAASTEDFVHFLRITTVSPDALPEPHIAQSDHATQFSIEGATRRAAVVS